MNGKCQQMNNRFNGFQMIRGLYLLITAWNEFNAKIVLIFVFKIYLKFIRFFWWFCFDYYLINNWLYRSQFVDSAQEFESDFETQNSFI